VSRDGQERKEEDIDAGGKERGAEDAGDEAGAYEREGRPCHARAGARWKMSMAVGPAIASSKGDLADCGAVPVFDPEFLSNLRTVAGAVCTL
jgi:hypothetical protein